MASSASVKPRTRRAERRRCGDHGTGSGVTTTTRSLKSLVRSCAFEQLVRGRAGGRRDVRVLQLEIVADRVGARTARAMPSGEHEHRARLRRAVHDPNAGRGNRGGGQRWGWGRRLGLARRVAHDDRVDHSRRQVASQTEAIRERVVGLPVPLVRDEPVRRGGARNRAELRGRKREVGRDRPGSQRRRREGERQHEQQIAGRKVERPRAHGDRGTRCGQRRRDRPVAASGDTGRNHE